jgi:hypothetical protein
MVRVVIIQVIMQLAITLAELLLLNKERIIHQAQRVKDVEFEFLGEDERIVD